MACVSHARDRVIFGDRIRSVGKQARDESGKYPVNEDDEEIFAHVRAKLATSAGSIALKRSVFIACAKT